MWTEFFFRYNREFIITEFVIIEFVITTEFHCASLLQLRLDYARMILIEGMKFKTYLVVRRFKKTIYNFLLMINVQAALVIFDLIICDFSYMQLRNCLFSGTYPLIYSNLWVFSMRCEFIICEAIFRIPISHI